MSEEDAKAFLKKLGEDKELQEKLKGAFSDGSFLTVAKEHGFDFTKEEWIAVIPKPKESELSEEDLGAVAGGGIHTEEDCTSWEIMCRGETAGRPHTNCCTINKSLGGDCDG